MNTSVCHRCGNAFQTAGRYAKFCPDCRKVRKAEMDAERKRMKREPAEDGHTMSLSDVNKAAKKSGMTYGQWVARGCK